MTDAPLEVPARDVTAWGPRDVVALGLLCLVFAATLLLIRPAGDFPLNDDWAYGLSVRSLVEGGTLRFTNAQSAPLLPQFLWGALACGRHFSFTALRWTTLSFGLIGVVGLYALLREVGGSAVVALLGAATLLANPIYLGLSYTFMSDVPFCALVVLASWCLVRSLKRGGWMVGVVGLGLLVVATMLRQVGMAFLLAWGVAWLVEGRRWSAWRVIVAALPSVVAVVGLVGFEAWLRHTGQLPAFYHDKEEALSLAISQLLHGHLGVMRVVGWHSIVCGMYVGLFVLPVLLICARSWRAVGVCGAIGSLIAVACAAGHRLMPMTLNILLDFGMGVRTLPGGGPAGIGQGWWFVVTALAAGGAVGCVVLVGSIVLRRMREAKGPAVYFLLAVVIYVTPLLFSYSALFDRYLLPVVVAVIALSVMGSRVATPPRWASVAAAVAIFFSLGYATAATHDYLAWNRVRWSAAGACAAEPGVGVGRVDAGFEFNNYHEYWERLRRDAIDRHDKQEAVERPGAIYRIASRPMAGWAVMKELDTGQWLPASVSRIYVLRRSDAP